MKSENVGVALDEDHPAGACGRTPGVVDAEQLRPLGVELALGGVEVLRLLVLAHRASAESVHPAACVGGGEHDPLAEAVVHLPGLVPRALDEADRQQLLVAEAGHA